MYLDYYVLPPGSHIAVLLQSEQAKDIHAQMITVVAALFGFSGVVTVYRLQSIEEARRHEALRFLEIKDWRESRDKWHQ